MFLSPCWCLGDAMLLDEVSSCDLRTCVAALCNFVTTSLMNKTVGSGTGLEVVPFRSH